VYTRDEVEDQLRGILMATMASSLGASQVPFLDMAANQALMAQQVKGDLTTAFARYGIGLDEFNVASVSLPEELQAALDERISAGMKGGMSADKMAGFTTRWPARFRWRRRTKAAWPASARASVPAVGRPGDGPGMGARWRRSGRRCSGRRTDRSASGKTQGPARQRPDLGRRLRQRQGRTAEKLIG
jgi:hypothetical protein